MKWQFMPEVMIAAIMAASPALAQSTAPSAPSTGSATPSTPLTADTVAALSKVCLPVLRGAKAKAVAPAAGFKFSDGDWIRPVDGQRQLDVSPPDIANPHLCTVTVTYAPGDGAQLRAALGAWARTQSPPLSPVQVGQNVAGSDLTTSQWAGQGDGGAVSVVLSQQQPAQGKSGNLQSTLMVSLSPT